MSMCIFITSKAARPVNMETQDSYYDSASQHKFWDLLNFFFLELKMIKYFDSDLSKINRHTE